MSYYGSSSSSSSSEITVLVVGKSGNGKSSLCNAVLGEMRFAEGRGLSATTVTAQSETALRGHMRLKVVDTPDVTNCKMNARSQREEVDKWRQLTLPRPFVVLLTVRCDVMYTAQEFTIYKEMLALWGDNSLKERLVVAFTFGNRQDNDLEDELRTVCQELKSVLSDAGGQYVFFNKKNEQSWNGIAYDIVNAVEQRKKRSPAGRGTSEDHPGATKPRPSGSRMTSVDQVMAEKTIRVVLLGKTGVGKSSTANTLLGRDCFHVSSGMSSCTQKCHWEEVKIESEHVVLQVTDTIGVSDTHREKAEVPREVGKSIAVTSPGPHVILMLIRCDTRFTKDEFLAYVTLKEMFGPKVTDYMIVVFVGMDAHGSTLEEQTKGLKQGIQSSPRNLKVVMEEVQWRFFGINNKASPSDKQRQAVQLIRMMKTMKHQHGGGYFMNSVSDHVNDLVRPLVSKRVTQGHMTQSEAVRETNKAIMEETESSDFFRKLCDFVSSKLIPALKLALEVAQIAVPIALEVAKVSGKCTVM